MYEEFAYLSELQLNNSAVSYIEKEWLDHIRNSMGRLVSALCEYVAIEETIGRRILEEIASKCRESLEVLKLIPLPIVVIQPSPEGVSSDGSIGSNGVDTHDSKSTGRDNKMKRMLNELSVIITSRQRNEERGVERGVRRISATIAATATTATAAKLPTTISTTTLTPGADTTTSTTLDLTGGSKASASSGNAVAVNKNKSSSSSGIISLYSSDEDDDNNDENDNNSNDDRNDGNGADDDYFNDNNNDIYGGGSSNNNNGDIMYSDKNPYTESYSRNDYGYRYHSGGHEGL